MTNFSNRLTSSRRPLPHRLLLFIIMLCSLLFSACGSETPTVGPNPLVGAPGSGNGANTGSTAGASVPNTAASAATTTPSPAQAASTSGQNGQPVSSGLGSGSGARAALPSPTVVGPDQRQVITLWTSGWKGNADYENFLNTLVDTYRSKYSKNFTLDWEDFSTDIATRLSDASAKNPKALPDLVLLNPGDLYQLAASEKLEDLAALVGSDVQSRYAIPAWEAMRYAQGGSSGTYALPWLASTRISIINKKLWQAAKLDPTKLPKNFDELDQYLPAMRDNTPQDVRAVWLHPDPVADFLMEDVPLYRLNADGKKEPAFNIGAAQGKWQYYFNRRKDGYFVSEALEGTYKDALVRYADNKLVMVMDGAPLLPSLKAQNSEVYNNTLVTLHPLSKGNVLTLQIQGWSVPKGAKNKRDALDFALFLNNDENQLAFAKLVQTAIPTTRKDLTDAFVTSNDEPLSQARALMVQALPQSRPPEQLIPAPISLATRDKLLNALFIAQSATWAKSVKPQDALTEASKAWAELLK